MVIVGEAFTFPWTLVWTAVGTVADVERRKALAIAGTATATLAAAGVAMAANFGLLGFADSPGPVGKLDAENVSQLLDATPSTVAGDPTTTTTTLPPDVQVVYEDIPVPVPAGGSAQATPPAAASGGTATPAAPAAPQGEPAPPPAPPPDPGQPQGGDVSNVDDVFDDHGGSDSGGGDSGSDDSGSGSDDSGSGSDDGGSGSDDSGSGSDDSGSGHGDDDD